MYTDNEMITRDRLLHTFDDIPKGRVIYVCAPAGCGKTVAVLQWLDARNHMRSVISLDEYDNDFASFCRRFCLALASCRPQNDALGEIASHPLFDDTPGEFALRAAATPGKQGYTFLVIDNLQCLDDEQVIRFLFILLKRLPKDFRIVLISRSDLPLGFSELLIKGGLTKITAEQLRFSNDEIVLLYKRFGVPLTAAQAENISRCTGGWAISINALLLAGGNPENNESLVCLEEFFRSGVWEGLDYRDREFLQNTSAAGELNPELCRELTGIPDSESFLDRLMRNGVFISRTKDGVYYYHRLFQNFLVNILKQRGEAHLYDLLKKEGEWYYARSDFYRAADCFIRCKNHEGIAKCIDMLTTYDRGDFVIEGIMPIIKSPEVSAAAPRYPFLLYMIAWAALAEGRADDAAAYMDQYYLRYAQPAMSGSSHAHNVFSLRCLDFRTSLRHLMCGLLEVPVINDSSRVIGAGTMNMPLFHRSIRDFSEFAQGDVEGNIALAKAAIGRLFRREAEMLAFCLAAGILYEQGYTERACVCALNASSEIENDFAPESKFCAMAILADILDSLGQQGEADIVLERIFYMLKQSKAHYLNRNYNALITRRKLQSGDIKAAKDWLSHNETTVYDRIDLYRIFETFTTCRAYIACGDYDSSIIALTRLSRLAFEYGRPLDIIEARMLTSIAYWKKKRGFQREALLLLEDAVSLAYKYGYTQIFVNEGTELSNMLSRMQARAEQRAGNCAAPVSFIKMLLFKTMEKQDCGLTSGQPKEQIAYTDKQKAVMRLLCNGKSYKEITELLGIKLPTLRSHIALIYKKLDVTSKTNAVMKIKTLGLLDME